MTIHSAFTPYPSGWNDTQVNLSTTIGATGTEGLAATTMTDIATTLTDYETIATTTVNITIFPTFNTTGFGYPNLTGPDPTDASENSFGKRQTCVMVSATIDGHLASWCNDWDGSTAVHESTYITTSKRPNNHSLDFSFRD